MIVAEQVTKYYGENAAVKDLNFEIADGEVVGLLGLNGAGKTTTLRILSGVLLPTAGKVVINGVDMANDPDANKSRIGFLPEVPPLYPEMTVEGFLEFVARIKGMKGDISSSMDEALSLTNLTHVRTQRIDTLSYGYRKRVGIAQTIIHRPALILLDEPTGGLDPEQVTQMRELIRGLGKKHTIIVSSHILKEIHELCDRLVVLKDGQIVDQGSEQELASRVSQTTTVDIEVRGDKQKLTTALSAMSHVSRHSIKEPSNGITEATIELDSDAREDLAKTLVGAGLGLRRLERVSLELEDVFLQLAGKAATQRNAQSKEGSAPKEANL